MNSGESVRLVQPITLLDAIKASLILVPEARAYKSLAGKKKLIAYMLTVPEYAHLYHLFKTATFGAKLSQARDELNKADGKAKSATNVLNLMRSDGRDCTFSDAVVQGIIATEAYKFAVGSVRSPVAEVRSWIAHQYPHFANQCRAEEFQRLLGFHLPRLVKAHWDGDSRVIPDAVLYSIAPEAIAPVIANAEIQYRAGNIPTRIPESLKAAANDVTILVEMPAAPKLEPIVKMSAPEPTEREKSFSDGELIPKPRLKFVPTDHRVRRKPPKSTADRVGLSKLYLAKNFCVSTECPPARILQFIRSFGTLDELETCLDGARVLIPSIQSFR